MLGRKPQIQAGQLYRRNGLPRPVTDGIGYGIREGERAVVQAIEERDINNRPVEKGTGHVRFALADGLDHIMSQEAFRNHFDGPLSNS